MKTTTTRTDQRTTTTTSETRIGKLLTGVLIHRGSAGQLLLMRPSTSRSLFNIVSKPGGSAKNIGSIVA